MDIGGLIGLLESIEGGELDLVARDLREPSPLAHEILNAMPYAYLDDAPLEERRTQAVRTRRWLDPRDAAELATLDPAAIARVRDQAWPEADTADVDTEITTSLEVNQALQARFSGVSERLPPGAQ